MIASCIIGYRETMDSLRHRPDEDKIAKNVVNTVWCYGEEVCSMLEIWWSCTEVCTSLHVTVCALSKEKNWRSKCEAELSMLLKHWIYLQQGVMKSEWMMLVPVGMVAVIHWIHWLTIKEHKATEPEGWEYLPPPPPDCNSQCSTVLWSCCVLPSGGAQDKQQDYH